MSAFALLVWLLGTPLWIWAGYMWRHIQLEPNQPTTPLKRIDRDALAGHPVLIWGPDGQIVEASFYSPRRSAREFGGKSKDYAAGWINWEADEVPWEPVAYMPVPAFPHHPRGDR